MGKFSDKFLGAFSLKDDANDDYDDEYYDDYEDDYQDEYEEKPKKGVGGLFSKKKKADQYDDEYYDDPAPAPAPAPAPRSQSRSRSTGKQHEVCIFKPSSIEDSREITETLLEGKAVVINFEGLHVEISQRIIDFISGSCYAMDGNLQKVSHYIFVATPNSVDISGDFQDLFGGSDKSSFDLSGFKSPLI